MTAHFLVEDAGEITNDVVFGGDTRLVTSAGPESSPSVLIVRDLDLVHNFRAGKRMTVHLDDEDPLWAGFIIKVGRHFWFDDGGRLHRKWLLLLADLPILFSRRFVFNQVTPERVQGPVYQAQTADTVAIDELLDDWLDLSADDLDLTSRVSGVGYVNPSGSACIGGNAFYPFNGGMRWGDAMEVIAQLPAAIFALVPGKALGTSPFGRLVYADVDETDAPFVLSDRPESGGGGGGYVVIPGTGGLDWDSYQLDTPPDTEGMASFDIYYPALDPGGFWGSVKLRLNWATPIHEVTLAVEDNSGGNVLVGRAPGNSWSPGGNDDYAEIAIDGGNWYTAKVYYDATDLKYKMWKREEPEPDWQVEVPMRTDWESEFHSPWLYFFYSGTVEMRLDNLTFYTTGGTVLTQYTFDDTTLFGLDGGFTWFSEVVDGQFSTGYDDASDSLFHVEGLGGAPEAGYRECTIWDGGEDLANDALAWGFGKGQNQGVFHRRTDEDSIAEHGLWQRGDALFNVWCQDTIEKVTDSIINGSPQSHRGQKDPIKSVEVITDQPGFVVGQRARFISHEWNENIILPVRKAEYTFLTPDHVRSSLVLSHALDRWGFEDPLPPFRMPGGGGELPPEIEGPCPAVFDDDFNRVVAVGLGDSPPPIVATWVQGDDDDSGAGDVSVNGSEAHLRNIGDGVPPPTTTNRVERQIDITGPDWRNGEFVLTGKVRATVDPPNHSSNGDYIVGVVVRDSTNEAQVSFFFLMSPRNTNGFNAVRGQIQAIFRDEIGGVAASYIAQNIYAEGPSGEVFVDGDWAVDPGTDWLFELDLSISRGDVRARAWHPNRTIPDYIYEQNPSFFHRTWTIPLLSGWGTGLVPASLHIDTRGSSNVPVEMHSYLDWARVACGAWVAPGVGAHVVERGTRVSDSQYSVSAAFDPATILVWRNGVLQRRGTDYTVVDAAAGIIEFTSSVSVFETVRVWYVSVGLPNG